MLPDRSVTTLRNDDSGTPNQSELQYDIGATGGIIVVLQTLIFLAAFVFAPKHGVLAARRKARAALIDGQGAV